MLAVTITPLFICEVTLSSLYIRAGNLVCWIKRDSSSPRLWSYQREAGSAEAWAGRLYVVVDRQPAVGSPA